MHLLIYNHGYIIHVRGSRLYAEVVGDGIRRSFILRVVLNVYRLSLATLRAVKRTDAVIVTGDRFQNKILDS